MVVTKSGAKVICGRPLACPSRVVDAGDAMVSCRSTQVEGGGRTGVELGRAWVRQVVLSGPQKTNGPGVSERHRGPWVKHKTTNVLRLPSAPVRS